jgi:hypothetical protein
MSARFVNIDHDTPLLLPPDLRDWVAPDHMVHFIMDAVKALDLSRGKMGSGENGVRENGVSVQILTEFTFVLSLQHATEPAYRISRHLLPRDGAKMGSVCKS